jgi:glutaminyl-tRNA synthetase
VRLFDRLFTDPNPDRGGVDYKQYLNPESVISVDAKVETNLADAAPESRYQFERLGYFCVDGQDSRPGAPVFNRTATLRDSWAKTGSGTKDT